MKKSKPLKRIPAIILSLSLPLISVLNCDAQVLRTITSTSNNTVTYLQIYEYNSVDAQPQFPGGNIELMKFINQERRYPHDAYLNGVEGRVVCGFVVNTDGTISNISVLKSVEESLDREALRIIASMPPWISGVLNNDPVPVFCTLVIPFRH